MKALVTGSSGFLLRNTLPDYDWEIIKYEPFKPYHDIDLIVHFGSPSDSYDFERKADTAISMVDTTLEIVSIAIANNCKLVFASSLGTVMLSDDYSVYKKAMEQYIEALVSDYVIMRIPRVYGSDRKKGLMKKIMHNNIDPTDWDREITYIEIEDFKPWFNDCLSKNGIQYYQGGTKTNTIREIKELFCAS